MDFELHDLSTEPGRDAFIWSLEETLAALARAEEEARDAAIADLLKHEDRRERVEWSRTVELKGPSGDTAYAVLARLGVCDRQGDIVDRGCLLNPPGDRVPVSAWDHSYLNNRDAAAAGFATVMEVDGELRAFVTFNDSDLGRSTAQRVHDLLPDWSWGLANIETRPLTAAEREAGATRAIHKVRVVEVSPVGRAASIASGTLLSHCESCALAGSGKCSAAGPGLPPCHPTRRRCAGELERLTATCAQLDVNDEKRRAALVDALLARADEQEQREAVAIAAAEAERDATIARLFERAGEDAPVRRSSWDDFDAPAAARTWPGWGM